MGHTAGPRQTSISINKIYVPSNNLYHFVTQSAEAGSGLMINTIARWVFRRSKRALFCTKRVSLMARGIKVHPSCTIAISAALDAGGGSISIGEQTSVEKGAIIRAYGGDMKIGSNCTVNPYTIIYGGGDVTIGNGVRIAPHVAIIG